MLTDKVVAEYNRIAPFYGLGDKLAFPYRRKLLQSMIIPKLELTEGQQVVDLCCGAGHNLYDLSRAVGSDGRVIAIDLSKKLLSQAQDKIQRHALHNVDVIQGDAKNLGQFVDQVDAVLMSLALSLMPDKKKVLEGMKLVVKPGAKLAFIEIQPFRGMASILNPLLYLAMLPVPNINQAVYKEARNALPVLKDVFPQQQYYEYYSGTYVVIAENTP